MTKGYSKKIDDMTKTKRNDSVMVGTALLGAILTFASAGGLTAVQGVIAGGATRIIFSEVSHQGDAESQPC